MRNFIFVALVSFTMTAANAQGQWVNTPVAPSNVVLPSAEFISQQDLAQLYNVHGNLDTALSDDSCVADLNIWVLDNVMAYTGYWQQYEISSHMNDVYTACYYQRELLDSYYDVYYLAARAKMQAADDALYAIDENNIDPGLLAEARLAIADAWIDVARFREAVYINRNTVNTVLVEAYTDGWRMPSPRVVPQFSSIPWPAAFSSRMWSSSDWPYCY